jgi:poly-gamma-glutamate synthesis protein (capsule biosynthesis protein)
MKSFSLVATGDSFITRRTPVTDPDFQDIAQLIGKSDVRFTNLETVIRRDEGFPAAQSGGTWATSPPEVLEDLAGYGFNLYAWANNHTLDYSYGGLSSTRHHLDQVGLAHAGVGANLAEASAIRYLETPSGRVALIAATSSFHESWIAGAQRADGPGRPGINPLRFSTIHQITREQLDGLRSAAGACRINAAHENRIKEGFVVPDREGTFRFGQHLFAESEVPGESTHPHPGDLRRIQKSVEEASRQADSVLVSIHAHEGKNGKKDLPADFLVAFSRSCVDAGAHAVIGHGPHVLRGCEIYKNRPIFYSLGNFIFQNESVPWQPADFYEKYSLEESLTVSEVFARRSGNGTRGLGINPKVWHSVIASWRMTGGELREITFHPITLGFGEPSHRSGTPRLTHDLAALEELVALSEPFGTNLRIEGGRAVWRSS